MISENPGMTESCQPGAVAIDRDDVVVSSTALKINIVTIKESNTDTEDNETIRVTIEKNVAIKTAANTKTEVAQIEEKRSEIYDGCLSSEQPSTSTSRDLNQLSIQSNENKNKLMNKPKLDLKQDNERRAK